ncbi:hypothetical protein BVER_00330c [Candidatus Burkholderia verschuerenii]|uniref:Uncharacterized protein n=1 Tax=Candidatus Burkholderia verschuerenii TaxID=242163 RepID=A0A0L0M6N1_9BURK|nr:hypothetical protein [Candidatus Burkholderia verschuerenii]KND58028.1 hypothetical protein BVER_00330c [Candidatus Burkholderia verschuerenii]
MNEKEFFDAFEAERWNFTFMDEADTTKPVQQVGLVAVFHLVDAYLPIRRKHIAEAFALYDEHYGDKLRGGYREDLGLRIRSYSPEEFRDCVRYIETIGTNDAVEFKWLSLPDLELVSDYMFGVYSPEGWYEQVHGSLTKVPISTAIASRARRVLSRRRM